MASVSLFYVPLSNRVIVGPFLNTNKGAEGFRWFLSFLSKADIENCCLMHPSIHHEHSLTSWGLWLPSWPASAGTWKVNRIYQEDRGWRSIPGRAKTCAEESRKQGCELWGARPVWKKMDFNVDSRWAWRGPCKEELRPLHQYATSNQLKSLWSTLQVSKTCFFLMSKGSDPAALEWAPGSYLGHLSSGALTRKQ